MSYLTFQSVSQNKWEKITFLSFFFFSFFEDRFCCGMVKQGNFLHVGDSSFDARFVKYYSFSLHYHKQCSTNNIQVKCAQIGRNVSDIFEHVFYR